VFFAFFEMADSFSAKQQPDAGGPVAKFSLIEESEHADITT
jgi:hypothetical protein